MIFNLISYIASGDRTSIIFGVVTLLLRIPAILLALSIHEASLGFVAYKLGDPTAKSLGRLTINPVKHIDPIGALAMLILGVGWAKPVPVNSRYFKHPKRDMALTAAAGPLSNILQGLVGVLLMFIGLRLYFGTLSAQDAASLTNSGTLISLFLGMIIKGETGIKVLGILFYLLYIYASLNFVLAIFNLIPIPPFDGSRLLFVFLPDKWYFGIMKYERFIMIGFLALFYLGGSTVFSVAVGWVIDLVYKGFFWILTI